MPRACRVPVEGGIFHLTHRCHEIMGLRKRYRLIDLDRLSWRLGSPSLQATRDHLENRLRETLAADHSRREPWWTESVAVGRPGFLEEIRPLLLNRRELEVSETNPGVWALRESPVPYGTF